MGLGWSVDLGRNMGLGNNIPGRGELGRNMGIGRSKELRRCMEIGMIDIDDTGKNSLEEQHPIVIKTCKAD